MGRCRTRMVEARARRAEWVCTSKALGAWQLQCAAAAARMRIPRARAVLKMSSTSQRFKVTE